ncbi:DUF429 domain-containing protein [Paenibacillus sacheonensis]|uniref:DUF429 domain-containing protein n=1 Tax=Paenibacillus sacheonensis TaxID=742054 RepID=A0A7X4YSG4_9BACL|nr:DUF429 domain-containing protein [Paenibacillus sacheonensis]MBM7569263.1 putative RNase H-like nuclease [Paenibacillus sacheonensis]NBC71727.1 DUF429 domain-containing protein [Paenibacillus sacheonensis]
MARGIGIDGCRSGWVAVILDNSVSNVQLITATTFNSLWSAINPKHNHDYILIDVPIGLPEGIIGTNNTHLDRNCDYDCRKMLIGNRKSSVFGTPTRQATRSSTPSQTNLLINNKKLSKQSEGIIPKIREIDIFINSQLTGSIQDLMEESHPELCFQRFNNNLGLSYRKKRSIGRSERTNILINAGLTITNINNLLSHYCFNSVAKDDILDAAILALTAFNINSGILPKLKVSNSNQYDYLNSIEMNMSYC